jgi:hypothetical protein
MLLLMVFVAYICALIGFVLFHPIGGAKRSMEGVAFTLRDEILLSLSDWNNLYESYSCVKTFSVDD